ncbi:hypothetical protein VP01_3954g2 [Puccinia sorghi]|uniref:Uncharacterized protein n=1 Tax=Puccinia sorghi TaxID=27349 RepID=A0A0L6USG4_9BASI|nr:hypothetical protein VP01_3954g2 [Puccinia sorghi]
MLGGNCDIVWCGNTTSTKKAIPTHQFQYFLFLFDMVVGEVKDDEEALLPSQAISLAAYRLLD